ncbi:hypothetical protein KI387_039111 [Taxus chinensis]|uniref:Uncharacterized protein n=1 Tax=Taxus chinensis TaxID=29808 RepID=A0AA38FAM7_TAXCH|nr:hypothetical protein KI387_039111 [Taxus chinensis]
MNNAEDNNNKTTTSSIIVRLCCCDVPAGDMGWLTVGIMATPNGSPSIITISDDTSGAIVGSPPIELVASNGSPQSYATQVATNQSSIQSVQPPLATSVHSLATSVATTCSTISGRISESLIPSAMILDSDLTTVLDMMHKVDATYLRLDALYTFLHSLSYDQYYSGGEEHSIRAAFNAYLASL